VASCAGVLIYPKVGIKFMPLSLFSEMRVGQVESGPGCQPTESRSRFPAGIASLAEGLFAWPVYLHRYEATIDIRRFRKPNKCRPIEME